MKIANQSVWNHAMYLSFDQALEKWSQIRPGDLTAREAALMTALEFGKVKYRRADIPVMSNQLCRYNSFESAYYQSVYMLRKDQLLSIDSKSFDRWQRAVDKKLVDNDLRGNKDVTERERTTHENITGALLTLLLKDKEDDIAGKSGNYGQQLKKFTTQNQLINALLEKYEGVPGVSQKTLEMKFKSGRDTFESSLLDSQVRKG